MPNGSNRNTEWQKALARKARDEIHAMPRPEGVTAQRWHCVIRLLQVMADYLPDPFPRQETLAARLDVSLRTVNRWVSWAVEIGVLEVEKSSYHGYWNHNLYGISTARHNGVWTTRHIDAQSSSYLRMKKASPLPSGEAQKEEVCAAVPASQVSMSDYDPNFTGIDDGAEPMSPSRPPKAEPRRTPAAQVKRHFQDEWDKVLLAPGGEILSMAVLFDSIAAFQANIKRELDQGKTVPDLNASIDLFCEAVRFRRAMPKEGQPVWKLWWRLRHKYYQPVFPPGEPVVIQDNLDSWRQKLDRPMNES